MPTISLTYISKIAFKAVLFLMILSFLSIFVNYLIGLIPPLNITGCMGFFVNSLGLILGLRLYLSILLYAFVFRYTLSLLSRALD